MRSESSSEDVSLFLRPLSKRKCYGFTEYLLQKTCMRHAKALKAENLQDEFGTLSDVSDSSSSSSASIGRAKIRRVLLHFLG